MTPTNWVTLFAIIFGIFILLGLRSFCKLERQRKDLEIIEHLKASGKNLIEAIACHCEADSTSCFERFARLLTLDELAEALPGFTHKCDYDLSILLLPHLNKCWSAADFERIESKTGVTLKPSLIKDKKIAKGWLAASPNYFQAIKRFKNLGEPVWARNVLVETGMLALRNISNNRAALEHFRDAFSRVQYLESGEFEYSPVYYSAVARLEKIQADLDRETIQTTEELGWIASFLEKASLEENSDSPTAELMPDAINKALVLIQTMDLRDVVHTFAGRVFETEAEEGMRADEHILREAIMMASPHEIEEALPLLEDKSLVDLAEGILNEFEREAA